MSSDPSSLESDLRRLRAAALDESLLARLDACAADRWTEPTQAETTVERHLQGFAPAALPASLMASLESTFAGTRFPTEQKIVRFPAKETSAPRRSRGWWSAAAVVALTGAIAALLVPVNHPPGKVAGHTKEPATLTAPQPSNLIPAGFNRGLSQASDQGVIWQSQNQPHRVLKLVYQDRVTLKDAAGKTYQVEQPRVEYILVPAKTD